MTTPFEPSGAHFVVEKPTLCGVLPHCAVLEWGVPVCLYDASLSSNIQWTYTVEWGFECTPTLQTCETTLQYFILPLCDPNDVCYTRIVAKGRWKENTLSTPSVKVEFATRPNLTHRWGSLVSYERGLFDALYFSAMTGDEFACSSVSDRMNAQVERRGVCRLSESVVTYVTEVQYTTPIPLFQTSKVFFLVPLTYDPVSPLWVPFDEVFSDERDFSIVLCGIDTSGDAAVQYFLTEEGEWMDDRVYCLCFGNQAVSTTASFPYALQQVLQRSERLLYYTEEEGFDSDRPLSSSSRASSISRVVLGTVMYSRTGPIGETRAIHHFPLLSRECLTHSLPFDPARHLKELQRSVLPSCPLLLLPTITDAHITPLDVCHYTVLLKGYHLQFNPAVFLFATSSETLLTATVVEASYRHLCAKVSFLNPLWETVTKTKEYLATWTVDIQLVTSMGVAEHTGVSLVLPRPVTRLLFATSHQCGDHWMAGTPSQLLGNVGSVAPLYAASPDRFFQTLEALNTVGEVGHYYLALYLERTSGLFGFLNGGMNLLSEELDFSVPLSVSQSPVVRKALKGLISGNVSPSFLERLHTWRKTLLATVGVTNDSVYFQTLREWFDPLPIEQYEVPSHPVLLELQLYGYFQAQWETDGLLSEQVSLESFVKRVLPVWKSTGGTPLARLNLCLFLWFALLLLELRLLFSGTYHIVVIGLDDVINRHLAEHIQRIASVWCTPHHSSWQQGGFVTRAFTPQEIPLALTALQCPVRSTVLLNVNPEDMETIEYKELYQLFKSTTIAFPTEQCFHCVIGDMKHSGLNAGDFTELNITEETVERLLESRSIAQEECASFLLFPSPESLQETFDWSLDRSTELSTCLRNISARKMADLLLKDIDCKNGTFYHYP